MKVSKLLSVAASAMIVCSSAAFTAANAEESSYLGYYGKSSYALVGSQTFTDGTVVPWDASKAVIHNTISAGTVKLTVEEAEQYIQDNKAISIPIHLDADGTEVRADSFGLSVSVDKRLTYSVKSGAQPNRFTGSLSENCSYLIGSGYLDLFQDEGIYTTPTDLWYLSVKLPSEVSAGDVFIISPYYRDLDTCDYEGGDTEESISAEAWTFNYGLINGGIEIVGDAPPSEPDTDIVYGDANGDSSVSVADATLIMQFIANPNDFKITDSAAADCDGNGDGITSGDALAIQKYLANNSYTLPTA